MRWWVLGLNAALIASTPVQGAHYFIDIFGGALVAAAAILAAPLLMRAFDRFSEKSRPAAWQGLDAAE